MQKTEKKYHVFYILQCKKKYFFVNKKNWLAMGQSLILRSPVKLRRQAPGLRHFSGQWTIDVSGLRREDTCPHFLFHLSSP